jgi:hypothetical protein
MNTHPSYTTGVVLNPVPSPVELVENTHAGASRETAVGPRPLACGCVRVFATSCPYIGHSPPPEGWVVQGAAASAAEVNEISDNASARPSGATTFT